MKMRRPPFGRYRRSYSRVEASPGSFSRRAAPKPLATRNSAFSASRSELKRTILPGAVGPQLGAAPRAIDVQFHVQPVVWQVVAEFVRPLDHRRAFVQRLVETQFPHLLRFLQPVKV